MKAQPIEKKKNCSDCQAAFSCSSGGCWCSKLPNVMPYSEEKDCLCPNCLTSAIQEKESQR